MSTECIEIEGEPFPQTSEAITLTQCLPASCNSVGSKIIIKTKINTVEGVVRSINGKIITVGYHAVEAGYTPCYKLSQCEIVTVRCYSCCDDRYFDLGSCDLTEENIQAAIGVHQLVGNIYLYSGSEADPDCLYKYSGFGPIIDPVNWRDAYGNLAAQFDQLEGENLATFLAWLATVFEGNGISFNVHQDGDRIIVTVGGGGGAGASSFEIDYDAGTITHNPNDGSGDVVGTLIVKEPNAPTEPYNWMLFVNTVSNALFVNVDGEAMLLGFLEDGEPTTCTDVIGCIVNNIEAGPVETHKWVISNEQWNTYVVNLVTHGTPNTITYFVNCSGTNLDDLILNLNNCPENPEGWAWVNNGGLLVLCTPQDANIINISTGNPAGLEVFNGVPTEAGAASTDLCAQFADCMNERGLIDLPPPALVFSANTTEASVEAESIEREYVSVRWTDTSGDPRVSYKDINSGWYHPVKKSIPSVIVYTYAPSDTLELIGNTTITQNINLKTGTGVPENARFVDIEISVLLMNVTRPPGSNILIRVEAATLAGIQNEYGFDSCKFADDDFTADSTPNLHNHRFTIKPKAGANATINFTPFKANGHLIQVLVSVVGWER